MLLERAADFDISIARSLSELAALASEWHELWLRDPNATPFQSPAWLIPWAKHFTAGEFCCAAVRADDQLVALIPTFAWLHPETCVSELLLLGTGISDYCDAVCAPEHPRAVDAAMEHLREAGEWNVIHFHELRPTSPLLNGCFEAHSVVPVLELPSSIDELDKVIPKAQLQNLSYYRRRAEKFGTCEWQTADHQTLDVMLERLFELHSARWRERGERGVFDDETVRAFNREAARALLQSNALRMYRVTMGGETVTVLYGFASHGRTYYYASGFDPEFGSTSPGTLMIGHAIEQSLREGCTHFDFLRGAERYKYLWGAKDTQTFRRVERRGPSAES